MHPEATKKRVRSVEGLASSKSIKSGGSVTVYAGYSAVTTGLQPASQKQKAPTSTPATSSSAPASRASSSTATAREALTRQLPEGWEMKRSRTTGRVYYVNEKLGKSQFDPPAGSTIKTETRKKKQRTSTRPKDGLDARLTDQNGVTGLVRAKEAKAGRWAKWQKVSTMLNEPDSEEEKA